MSDLFLQESSHSFGWAAMRKWLRVLVKIDMGCTQLLELQSSNLYWLLYSRPLWTWKWRALLSPLWFISCADLVLSTFSVCGTKICRDAWFHYSTQILKRNYITPSRWVSTLSSINAWDGGHLMFLLNLLLRSDRVSSQPAKQSSETSVSLPIWFPLVSVPHQPT